MRFSILTIVGALLGCQMSPAAPTPAAPMEVRLLSNLASPQPAGTPIGLTTQVTNPERAMYVFQYSVSVSNGPFRIVRDFSQNREFIWMPALYEHAARLKVAVRNNDSKQLGEGELPFEIVSRIKDSQPIVTSTAHPLVALLSAPACSEGAQFRAAFQRVGEEALSHTGWQACRASLSNNVYVAGMRADSDYRMRPETMMSGKGESGPWVMHRTGLLDGGFPVVSTAVPRAAGGQVSEPLTIYGIVESGRPVATDPQGKIVWYLPQMVLLTRMLPGGNFLAFGEGANSANDMKRLQVVREFDLAGNVLRETNISRVAEQLDSFGIHSSCKAGSQECVPGFHHEAIRLPNGHTLVLTGLERMFPAGTQASKEKIDVLGDLVVDLDENLQATWVWNAFDHLDIKRVSLGDEKCHGGPGGGGCTPVFLDKSANGWLHSNSLNYEASSGDLLISIPEQDWVIKIDYKNGKGTGKIIWKLGAGGDFTAKSSDPHPWFSYQHDAGFEPVDSHRITLLDDGHRRKEKDPKANNRGQVWEIDEAAKTAALVYNADLGVYALAVGSGQSLSQGGYAFDAGFLHPPFISGRTIETAPDGSVAYAQEVEGAIVYRSFRVADLYSPPPK